MDQDVENLVKKEQSYIIRDIFEYLPIRGLLQLVLKFNTIKVKREWRIEKIHRDKVYPVVINDISKMHKISFNISDKHTLSIDEVDLQPSHGYKRWREKITYHVHSRYSISSNVLEYMKRKFNYIHWNYLEDDDRTWIKKYIDGQDITEKNIFNIRIDLLNRICPANDNYLIDDIIEN